MAIGSAAEAVADQWTGALTKTGKQVHILKFAGTVPAEEVTRRLEVHAQGPLNGWRLAMAGPVATVLSAAAAVRQVGGLHCELTLHATDLGTVRVYCPHCRSTTLTKSSPGAVIGCSGCGRELRTRPHLSRRLAGYLGSDIHAEELA
ncbi:hypothetical protein HER39_17745 [Arthrobacter deserti]|uniref:Dimethylamine monooxygenase subunit DmmA-like C-terminal domain-containing protein n=1 Tax=Arthrobacter deserti TaxID=1742687 RepID=A0ABX1JUE9_9MICC|nr:hypothetical protein [Arthrobacter deserti]